MNVVPQIPVSDLNDLLSSQKDLQVIDAHQPSEYSNGPVPSAVNVPPARVLESAGKFNPIERTAVICARGFRLSATTSILERLGFKGLLNVLGGTVAWIKAGYPVVG